MQHEDELRSSRAVGLGLLMSNQVGLVFIVGFVVGSYIGATRAATEYNSYADNILS